MSNLQVIEKRLFSLNGMAVIHKVLLSYIKDGKEVKCIREYSFSDGQSKGINIDCSDYLCFIVNKSIIMFSYPQWYDLLKSLEDVIYLYELKDMYIKNSKGELFINSKYKNQYTYAEGVKEAKFIIMPDIDENNEPCLTICINNITDCVKLKIEQMYTLYTFIKGFNLYESSQNLLNYAMIRMGKDDT